METRSIKNIKNNNTDIKKALNNKEIIWQGYYSWGKYKLKIAKRVIGTFDEFQDEYSLRGRYPQYYKFETITPEPGKYLVFGFWKTKGDYIEDVKAKNKNEYPRDGQKGDYWYVFKI